MGRFPTRFILETYRSKYRFFEKHYGRRALAQIRWVSLLHVWLRRTGYGLLRRVRPSKALDDRLAMYQVLARWNWQLDPVRFIEAGEEPTPDTLRSRRLRSAGRRKFLSGQSTKFMTKNRSLVTGGAGFIGSHGPNAWPAWGMRLWCWTT